VGFAAEQQNVSHTRLNRSAAACYISFVAKPSIDVADLSREEQFDLLDRLWDCLGRDSQALPLSEEQQRDLDLRLDELERDGPTGLSWEEVVEQVRAKPQA